MNDNETFGSLTVTLWLNSPNARPHRATLYREHKITEEQAHDKLRALCELNRRSLDWAQIEARFQPYPVDLTTR